DGLLTLAFLKATLTLPIAPPQSHLERLALPVLRLSITFLFCLRLIARLLPPALDLVESIGLRFLVAARHLRSKKSGFLAAIGALSVLAVSVSSCALTTTLSVMGGFRNDLKRKILGSHAHIAIDREHGTFEGWEPLLLRVSRVHGVVGA